MSTTTKTLRAITAAAFAASLVLLVWVGAPLAAGAADGSGGFNEGGFGVPDGNRDLQDESGDGTEPGFADGSWSPPPHIHITCINHAITNGHSQEEAQEICDLSPDPDDPDTEWEEHEAQYVGDVWCPTGLTAWRFYGTESDPTRVMTVSEGDINAACRESLPVAVIAPNPRDAGVTDPGQPWGEHVGGGEYRITDTVTPGRDYSLTTGPVVRQDGSCTELMSEHPMWEYLHSGGEEGEYLRQVYRDRYESVAERYGESVANMMMNTTGPADNPAEGAPDPMPCSSAKDFVVEEAEDAVDAVDIHPGEDRPVGVCLIPEMTRAELWLEHENPAEGDPVTTVRNRTGSYVNPLMSGQGDNVPHEAAYRDAIRADAAAHMTYLQAYDGDGFAGDDVADQIADNALCAEGIAAATPASPGTELTPTHIDLTVTVPEYTRVGGQFSEAVIETSTGPVMCGDQPCSPADTSGLQVDVDLAVTPPQGYVQADDSLDERGDWMVSAPFTGNPHGEGEMRVQFFRASPHDGPGQDPPKVTVDAAADASVRTRRYWNFDHHQVWLSPDGSVIEHISPTQVDSTMERVPLDVHVRYEPTDQFPVLGATPE